LDPTTPLTGNNGSSTGRFENAGTNLYIHNDGGRSSILPVELTSFTATVEKGGVALNWSTASEKNNDRFEVLRSTDGVNFVKIGEVDGNGTTSVPQNYSFLDNTVSSGVYYYQLRQVDFDGASELSKIVSVEINVTQAFTAGNFFPNPTSNATSLIVTLPTDSRISFSLFTTDGRQVFSKVYNLGKGQQRIDFDFGQLPAGTYIGSIQTESERVTKKLIIQH
jgi:hypothetical protein